MGVGLKPNQAPLALNEAQALGNVEARMRVNGDSVIMAGALQGKQRDARLGELQDDERHRGGVFVANIGVLPVSRG